MFYACIFDKWTDELWTADPCETYAEAEQFIAEELTPLPHPQVARIITEAEYLNWKKREYANAV